MARRGHEEAANHERDLRLLEAARQAWLRAAVDAYEDAGIRGLCGDGRWEYVMSVVRTLDLRPLLDSAPSPSQAGGPDAARG